MHAIVVDVPGGPEQMRWNEVPDPIAAPGEVLIDITATAVNRADLLQRQGHYPPPPGASPILGLECAGMIAGHGPGVSSPPLGTPIVALLSGGGYAQRVAVPVQQVMAVPSGVDLITAGAVAEVACTVWSNLAMTAHVQAEEWVLIHGGGSGVGTFAIQVARAMGAHVAVTAGSAAKLDACRELGADVCINYKEQDFVEQVIDCTGGTGPDVILDNLGAAYLERNVTALARNGRLVTIGLQGGTKAELNINTLLRKNASITCTSLRGRPISEKALICEQVQQYVWPWIAAGIVRPVIDRVLPITDAALAHALIAEGAITGKLGLAVA